MECDGAGGELGWDELWSSSCADGGDDDCELVGEGGEYLNQAKVVVRGTIC